MPWLGASRLIMSAAKSSSCSVFIKPSSSLGSEENLKPSTTIGGGGSRFDNPLAVRVVCHPCDRCSDRNGPASSQWAFRLSRPFPALVARFRMTQSRILDGDVGEVIFRQKILWNIEKWARRRLNSLDWVMGLRTIEHPKVSGLVSSWDQR
jgi:hypothetical protein